MTFKNATDSLLITFFNSALNFFNLKTGKIIFTKDLSQHDLNNKDYYLSPTNLLTNKLNNIIPIFNTHNFIALNNSNNLILVSFSSSTSIKTVQSNNSMKFESFKMNNEYLAAYNLNGSKLFIYNIKNLLETNSFDKYEFVIELRNSAIYQFGMRNEHLFVIESKKILKLYSLYRKKLTAETPLYSESNIIAISNDYAMLVMKDKRIISFLICDDSDQVESYKKIETLNIG
jgi:hypothetical protein